MREAEVEGVKEGCERGREEEGKEERWIEDEGNRGRRKDGRLDGSKEG